MSDPQSKLQPGMAVLHKPTGRRGRLLASCPLPTSDPRWWRVALFHADFYAVLPERELMPVHEPAAAVLGPGL